MLKFGIQIPRDKGTGTSVLIHGEGEGSFSEGGPGDHILAEATGKTKP